MFSRSAGVLLHVSSLPGRNGIGDLGPAAMEWIDWLADTGCRYWQILPLGPSGYGDSPYSSPSSHAGNLNLISPDLLDEFGLSEPSDAVGSADRVDFPSVIRAKWALINEAHDRMPKRFRTEFAQFREEAESWLEPHCLFMALKDAHSGAAWFDWDDDLARGDPAAIVSATQRLDAEMSHHAFAQFLFSSQLRALRRHAADRGVQIIGDVPLYVAMDSVEVWQRPDLFAVEGGRPLQVAGVSPDSFSPVGQVWDTPVYRWEAHAVEDFSWWVSRIETFAKQADVLRIDHFTGFHQFYAIDAETRDVWSGEWQDGPGSALFDAVRNNLGDITMILEDLGPLGDEVERLRLELGYPGMRVLQEAFDDDAVGGRLPQNFPENCAVYTGTHDNDTARGRFDGENEGYRRRALEYTAGAADTFAWDLVSKAWESLQLIAVAPMQDLLGLGSEARMNVPGTPSGNWQWRMPAGAANQTLAANLAELTERTGRTV